MVTRGTSVRSMRWRLSCARTLSAGPWPAPAPPARTRAAHRTCARRSRSPCRGRPPPQALRDAAHGLPEQRGRLRQLHHHDLPGLGRAGRALGDQHILAVALVFRRHQPHAAFLQQATDDRVLGRSMMLDERPRAGRAGRGARCARARGPCGEPPASRWRECRCRLRRRRAARIHGRRGGPARCLRFRHRSERCLQRLSFF